MELGHPSHLQSPAGSGPGRRAAPVRGCGRRGGGHGLAGSLAPRGTHLERQLDDIRLGLPVLARAGSGRPGRFLGVGRDGPAMRKAGPVLLFLFAALLWALLPRWAPARDLLTPLAWAAMYVPVVLGLAFLYRMGGFLSLGHAVAYGLGAWWTAYLIYSVPWNPLLLALLSVGGATLVTAVLTPLLHLGPKIFLLGTLAFAMAFWEWFGFATMLVDPWAGPGGGLLLYTLAGAWVLAALSLLRSFALSPYGRSLALLRTSREAAAAVGIPSVRYQSWLLAATGFWAAGAGAWEVLAFGHPM